MSSRSTKSSNWRDYERKKAEIQAKNLPPKDYEKAIRRLIAESNL